MTGYEPKRGDIVRVGNGKLRWVVEYVSRFSEDDPNVSLRPPPDELDTRVMSTTARRSRLTLLEAAPPPPPRRTLAQIVAGALSSLSDDDLRIWSAAVDDELTRREMSR